MKRRRGYARRRTVSTPPFIIIRTAVGAVYQTLIPSRWRIPYQRSASKSASSTTQLMPLLNGEMIPYEVPVTQPGSAVHQKTSSG